MTFKRSEWFSPDMEFPPQKKTNLHNIAEIMLKVSGILIWLILIV
jgi:hypothetical protein